MSLRRYSPLVAWLFLSPASLGVAHGENLLRVENVDEDPEKEIVLENRFCRLVLNASVGATGVSLTPKPTETEMVLPRGGAGLFVDAIWQQGMLGDWRDAYAYTIDADTPEKATLTFSKRGRTGDILKWITIRKSITMRADSPAIEVRVRVENEEAAMRGFKVGYWAHHQIAALRQDNAYFLPTAQGIRRFLVTGKSSTQEYWTYDAARGWIAALAEDGTGLAFRLDYRHLMCFYQWLKSTMTTVEWLYRTQEIPNGGAFETSYQVIPFHGLPYVDGVGDGIVGAIVYGRHPQPSKTSDARVMLTGTSGKVGIEVEWRRLPDNKWTSLSKAELEVVAGKTVGVPFQLQPPEEGAYAIRAQLTRSGKPIGVLDRLLSLGKSSGRYAMEPESKRAGNDQERYAVTLERPDAGTKGKKPTRKLKPEDVPADVPYELGVFSTHMPWARPYHLGRTKAFLATQAQVARDVVEVAQRLDLDFKTTTFGIGAWKLPGDLVKPWSHGAAMFRMKEILTKDQLDGIVLRAPWSAFDKEVQTTITERVKAGAGLVYVSYDRSDKDETFLKLVSQGPANTKVWGSPDATWTPMAEHYICGALPYEKIQTPLYAYGQTDGEALLGWKVEESAHPMVVVREHGKGRVVCLNYNPTWFPGRTDMFTPHFGYMKPFEFMTLPDYDQSWPRFHRREYAFALLSRCILWAARREPKLHVAGAKVRLDGDQGELALSTQNTGAAGKFRAELLLRDNWSRLLSQQTADITVGPGRQDIFVPFDAATLKGGTNFVDFRLLSHKGIVEFGSAAIERPAVSIGLALSKDPTYDGEQATATVTIGDPLPEGARIVLALEDHHRRVLHEELVAIEGKSAQVTLRFENLETPAYWVRATVVKDGRVLGERDYRGLHQIPVVLDDWLLGVETYGGNVTSHADEYHALFRRHGYRLAHTSVRYCHSLCSMRSAGMMAGDITGWLDGFRMKNYQDVKREYAKTGDRKWLMRDPCVNDPAYRAKMADRMKRYGLVLRPYGVWDHTIIDEFSLTYFGDAYDFCFGPHCLKKFREWAKPQYRDLAELNESYGTTFKTWDEVLPSTFREAQERGRYAGWADHRRFMELSVYDYFSWARAELRKLDPAAKISLSGTQLPHPYNGHDVWLRCKTFDGLWSYRGYEQIVMHREWGKKSKPGWYDFPWRGYASRGPEVDQHYWEVALHGSTGAAYWWFLNVVNPDWRLSETGKWTDHASRELREGLGQLLLGCELEVAPIALHYSQASTRGSYARRAFQAWHGTRGNWSRLLLGLGLQHTFRSYEQLEKRQLQYPEARVLILPYSIAISDAEADAIREFVEAGGTVIADLQAGIMDEHCRARSQGALDDLFGIKRLDSKTGFVSGEPRLNPPDRWKLPATALDVKLAEPSVVLAGGKSLIEGTGAPGVIVNRTGKGKTYYLNFSMAKFGTLIKRGTHDPIMQLIGQVLSDSGVRPPVRIHRMDGTQLLDIDVFSYRAGKQWYVGLLPRWKGEENEKVAVGINFGKKLFVRELRSGKDYGRVRTIQVELTRPYTQLLAAMPARADGLDADVTPSLKQGGTATLRFALRTERGKPGMRVVRVTVDDPDGEPVHRFEKNLRVEDGQGEMRMFIARNDPAGTYTVVARDVASGEQRELTFDVQPCTRLVPSSILPQYPDAALPGPATKAKDNP